MYSVFFNIIGPDYELELDHVSFDNKSDAYAYAYRTEQEHDSSAFDLDLSVIQTS